jgi:hypothetical protein
MPRADKKGLTQKLFLVVRVPGAGHSALMRWSRAALIVDDPEILWSSVRPWAMGSRLPKGRTGADRIVIWRAAYDRANARQQCFMERDAPNPKQTNGRH